MDDAEATSSPAPLAFVGLVLAVVALLLTPFPWIGVVASVISLLIAGLAWRSARRTGGRVGLAQAASGAALASLAISGVWTAVAATLPQSPGTPALNCSTPNLPPADQARCGDQP